MQRVLAQNLKQERKLVDGWVLLGRAWREYGDYREALRALKQAVEMDPSNKDAKRHYKRVWDELAEREAEEAKSGLLGKIFGRRRG